MIYICKVNSYLKSVKTPTCLDNFWLLLSLMELIHSNHWHKWKIDLTSRRWLTLYSKLESPVMLGHWHHRESPLQWKVGRTGASQHPDSLSNRDVWPRFNSIRCIKWMETRLIGKDVWEKYIWHVLQDFISILIYCSSLQGDIHDVQLGMGVEGHDWQLSLRASSALL